MSNAHGECKTLTRAEDDDNDRNSKSDGAWSQATIAAGFASAGNGGHRQPADLSMPSA